RFSSSFGYSLMNIENSNGQAADAYHRGQYAVSNLLFYPVDNVMIGGEFQWGRRANFGDGFSVNDYRVQFAFRYNFSKAFSL
ncbi:MAG: DcaP family trimeric outer membrane transporter, partial [Blastocatellia bacterium]